MRRRKGFTLAELLIVVAIISVLVAIGIPVFNGQLEKSRLAVDLHTAREIESVLAAAVNDGSIELAPGKPNDASGAWVLICRDEGSWPSAYNNIQHPDTVFCGTDPAIKVNGVSSAWNVYNNDIQKILESSGIKVENLKLRSSNNSAKDGWDWIIIEVGYLNNQIFTKIYSGFKGNNSGANKFPGKSQTNIEKIIG